MPYTARVVVPNYVYHITQRGNYRQNIFQDDEDRSVIFPGFRKHTLLRRPLGTKAFIAKAGRILSVLPGGRPKKQKHKQIVSVPNYTNYPHRECESLFLLQSINAVLKAHGQ